MAKWEFAAAIDPQSRVPLFVQIAQGIARDIRRGRLKPGAPLPGSRALAATLRVHRNTVIAAYEELVAEGWVETHGGRGTYVCDELPEVRPRRFAPRATPAPMGAHTGFDLGEPFTVPQCGMVSPTSGTLALSGWPDLRLVPAAAVGSAFRRAMRHHATKLLTYQDPRGRARLRTAVAAMLAQTRGLAASADNILITRGSQMALALIALTLVRDGDIVAVENPGYRRGWVTFRQTGARVVPVPVDDHGLCVSALADLIAREPGRVRAVYVTPHHQFPTTVTLSPSRRLELIELARAHRFAIVEDDYDHEFHYDGRPVLPIASADGHGVVIYVGTLSKTLAPGLRLGYVTAPTSLISRLAERRLVIDNQGDAVLEEAIAELLDEGEVQRHIHRMRRVYQSRRDALVDALRGELGDRLQFTPPSGGTAVYARVRGIDADEWLRRSRQEGVTFEAGGTFTFEPPALPAIRAGFASLNEAELREAVRRMVRALPVPADREMLAVARRA